MHPNILFLVFDSFRSDKFFGNNKTSKTPNLDLLLKNGTYFDQAISTADGTFLTMSSIFNGLYPFITGIRSMEIILTKDNFKIKSQFFKLFQNIIDDVSVKAYTERGGKLKDIDNKFLIYKKDLRFINNINYYCDFTLANDKFIKNTLGFILKSKLSGCLGNFLRIKFPFLDASKIFLPNDENLHSLPYFLLKGIYLVGLNIPYLFLKRIVFINKFFKYYFFSFFR